MGVSDFFTGGAGGKADDDLRKALMGYEDLQAPTTQQLSLPQLQEYVQAGIMTPAEAQAYLQNSNAYANENVPQTGTAAMQQALGELSGIADAGPMGTPLEEAQTAHTIQEMNNAVQGQRGAIEQQMAAKGTPAAMIQAALQNQYAGQDAQQAYHNSMDQQAAAYQAAVQALSEKANVGGALQGMQNTQANTVAQAQNAMQQFNAANQQQTSAQNAQLKQQANMHNAQNAQNVSNANVQQNNARTTYNTTQAPETAYQNQLQKVGGIAGVGESQASNAMAQGQQNAGLWSGLIGAGATLAAGPLAGYAVGQAINTTNPNAPGQMPGFAGGGVVSDHEYCYHDGGICMEDGGMVPGQPEVAGDSLKNDKVQIMASPGEAVIPRTAVQQHMPEVLSLIAGAREHSPHGPSAAHPHDIASVLEGLRQIRMGVH